MIPPAPQQDDCSAGTDQLGIRQRALWIRSWLADVPHMVRDVSRPGVVLEMTRREQLRPAPELPGLVIDEVSPPAASVIRQLYVDIWRQLGGGGRQAWSPSQWAEELAAASIRTWLATLDGTPVGFAELEWQPNGDVGIVEIGVVPTVQGKGIGADLLTRCTRLAWQIPTAHGQPTSRVWVWTIPDEHPHTISNYLSRGFAVAEHAQEPK
jgi:GNAT superfamily N-acetyltransferase